MSAEVLKAHTVESLKQMCRDAGIRGYSGKTKAELVKLCLKQIPRKCPPGYKLNPDSGRCVLKKKKNTKPRKITNVVKAKKKNTGAVKAKKKVSFAVAPRGSFTPSSLDLQAGAKKLKNLKPPRGSFTPSSLDLQARAKGLKNLKPPRGSFTPSSLDLQARAKGLRTRPRGAAFTPSSEHLQIARGGLKTSKKPGLRTVKKRPTRFEVELGVLNRRNRMAEPLKRDRRFNQIRGDILSRRARADKNTSMFTGYDPSPDYITVDPNFVYDLVNAVNIETVDNAVRRAFKDLGRTLTFIGQYNSYKRYRGLNETVLNFLYLTIAKAFFTLVGYKEENATICAFLARIVGGATEKKKVDFIHIGSESELRDGALQTSWGRGRKVLDVCKTIIEEYNDYVRSQKSELKKSRSVFGLWNTTATGAAIGVALAKYANYAVARDIASQVQADAEFAARKAAEAAAREGFASSLVNETGYQPVSNTSSAAEQLQIDQAVEDVQTMINGGPIPENFSASDFNISTGAFNTTGSIDQQALNSTDYSILGRKFASGFGTVDLDLQAFNSTPYMYQNSTTGLNISA